MNNYIRKIKEKLDAVESYYTDIKELLLIDDIDDINRFIFIFSDCKHSFNYSIFELELKLRALRDKLDHG
jgi:hypothetical protein